MSMQPFLLVQALKQEKIHRTPLWIMRQAGRYLPEYLALRARAKDFLALCKHPTMAMEATLQPIRRFKLDAAIIFSDILTLPDALNLGLHLVEGKGPIFSKPLRSTAPLAAYSIDRIMSSIDYVMETIMLVKTALPRDIPLIGFAGSPWTLACYMVEGQSSRSFNQLLQWRYSAPQEVQVLLGWLAEALSQYLILQIQAGADVVMLFDTWGGLLSAEDYQQFSKPFLQHIITSVKMHYPQIPVIVFVKGIQKIAGLCDIGMDAISVDWTVNLTQARQRIKNKVVLQGNLHPAVLLTCPQVIEQAVQHVLKAYGSGHGHVFNLGHGILPHTPLKNVEAMIDAVRQWSPGYHAD